jgi:hypothetical protein
MVSYVGIKPHLLKKLQKSSVIAKLEIFAFKQFPFCALGV